MKFLRKFTCPETINKNKNFDSWNMHLTTCTQACHLNLVGMVEEEESVFSQKCSRQNVPQFRNDQHAVPAMQ